MTSMNLYSKEQIDDKIPPTTGASVGDVLTVGSSGTEWSTPSGGGITRTVTEITSATVFKSLLQNANIGDEFFVCQSNPNNEGFDRGFYKLGYIGDQFYFGGSGYFRKSGSLYSGYINYITYSGNNLILYSSDSVGLYGTTITGNYFPSNSYFIHYE